jgi:hypothetical protein
MKFSRHGQEENMFIQGFGGKTWEKRHSGLFERRWKDNIDVEEDV